MTDTTSRNDPTAPLVQTKKWRWWHFLLAALGAIILLSMFRGGSLDLRVSVNPREPTWVQIVNSGTKPIEITSVKINDRDDCRVRTMTTNIAPAFVPFTLDIGDGDTIVGNCRVLRITVVAKSGTATYEFK